MDVIRWGFILSGVHLLLAIAMFMVFGLHPLGLLLFWLLWVWESLGFSAPHAPSVAVALTLLNSLLWGFGIAFLIKALRQLARR